MSYYARGDYYRGDYYRGDPGLLKTLGKIGGAVAGFITGGPAGAVAGHIKGGAIGGAVESFVSPSKPKASAVAPPVMPGGLQLGPISVNPGGILPGGAPFIQWNSSGAGGECPKGFHLDKATRSRCVRNRSMNVLNPKALRRGLRRAEGFEKIARRTVNGLRSGPKKFKSKARKR